MVYDNNINFYYFFKIDSLGECFKTPQSILIF